MERGGRGEVMTQALQLLPLTSTDRDPGVEVEVLGNGAALRQLAR